MNRSSFYLLSSAKYRTNVWVVKYNIPHKTVDRFRVGWYTESAVVPLPGDIGTFTRVGRNPLKRRMGMFIVINGGWCGRVALSRLPGVKEAE